MSVVTPFVAGDALTAAQLNGFLAAWTAYTPTWTTSAGTPAVGNGTLTGSWLQIGKTFDFRIELTCGSSTTFGTAGSSWRFTLPTTLLSTKRHRWLATAYDSGTADYTAYARYVSAGPYLEMVVPTAATGTPDAVITNTVPFTWATGDMLLIQGRVEST